jgi:hypothetical protein
MADRGFNPVDYFSKRSRVIRIGSALALSCVLAGVARVVAVAVQGVGLRRGGRRSTGAPCGRRCGRRGPRGTRLRAPVFIRARPTRRMSDTQRKGAHTSFLQRPLCQEYGSPWGALLHCLDTNQAASRFRWHHPGFFGLRLPHPHLWPFDRYPLLAFRQIFIFGSPHGNIHFFPPPTKTFTSGPPRQHPLLPSPPHGNINSCPPPKNIHFWLPA